METCVSSDRELSHKKPNARHARVPPCHKIADQRVPPSECPTGAAYYRDTVLVLLDNLVPPLYVQVYFAAQTYTRFLLQVKCGARCSRTWCSAALVDVC